MDRDTFQREVLADLGSMAGDPLEFARYSFPWGEGDLAGFDGPDDWQAGVLADVRDGLIDASTALRIAVASGHGIGKSALVAWLILWTLATAPDSRGVVTANTDTQLRTKTWPELTKWHRRFIGAFMFEVTATAIYSTQAGHEKNWRVDLVPWSERNTEAFAGLHNKGKRILLVFDEASAIPEVIWETAEGALTDSDTEILWLVAGNPTRNSGRFRECFGKFRTRWLTRQIDSRTSRLSNKTQIAEWVNDYGEDSDFVRVRVRGVFPRAGEQQLIPIDVIEAAIARALERDDGAPLVLGIDVARFGDDASVFRFRAGRDARTIPPLRFRGLDTMQLAGFAAEQCDKWNPVAVFVDGNGVGGGVVDRLRGLGYPVRDVQAGGKARNERDYHNKTAECWGLMRDWLTTGGIDDGRELRDDLEARQYGFDDKNRLQLESKQDMKKRGVASPDDADALALTFAEPVARVDLGMRLRRRVQRAITEYATFG